MLNAISAAHRMNVSRETAEVVRKSGRVPMMSSGENGNNVAPTFSLVRDCHSRVWIHSASRLTVLSTPAMSCNIVYNRDRHRYLPGEASPRRASKNMSASMKVPPCCKDRELLSTKTCAIRARSSSRSCIPQSETSTDSTSSIRNTQRVSSISGSSASGHSSNFPSSAGASVVPSPSTVIAFRRLANPKTPRFPSRGSTALRMRSHLEKRVSWLSAAA
mmetsp:Transcript_121378/g.226850  ORF Transcript_121378/g.226850 Transcript_121378/m.226850 type:complete len:218 (+) Transcript_121378:231-884(+)